MAKRIQARETARLLGRPLEQQTASGYAHAVTLAARAVTRLQAKAVRLRRELKKVQGQLSEARRMLRLTAQAIEPLDQGEL